MSRLAEQLRAWWPTATPAVRTKPDARAELALCAQRSVCAAMRLQTKVMERGVALTHRDLEDHRSQILGDLLTTLDTVSPGMGEAFMAAMHPLTTSYAADEAAATVSARRRVKP
jgi:hypothetical protein